MLKEFFKKLLISIFGYIVIYFFWVLRVSWIESKLSWKLAEIYGVTFYIFTVGYFIVFLFLTWSVKSSELFSTKI